MAGRLRVAVNICLRSSQFDFDSSDLVMGHTVRMNLDAGALDPIRDARRRLAASGPPRVREDGDFDRVSLPAEDGDVLRDLLMEEDAATVVEIGLAYGASALAISEALVAGHGSACRHLIVDAFQEQFHDAGWTALVDLFFLGWLVRPGGLVVLDDCQWPSVAAAARYFELNAGWTCVPIARPTRLRAYRLPPTREEPDFREFVPFIRDSKSK